MPNSHVSCNLCNGKPRGYIEHPSVFSAEQSVHGAAISSCWSIACEHRRVRAAINVVTNRSQSCPCTTAGEAGGGRDPQHSTACLTRTPIHGASRLSLPLLVSALSPSSPHVRAIDPDIEAHSCCMLADPCSAACRPAGLGDAARASRWSCGWPSRC